MALCLGLFGLCRPAHAQRADARFDDPYLAPKLMAGFGGEESIDLEVDATTSASVLASDDDLEPTAGLGFAYMHPVLELFAIGGQVSIAYWISSTAEDDDQKRDLCVALSAVPQFRIEVLPMLEAYLSVPFGLTLDFSRDDEPRPNVRDALARRVELGTGVGYHAGVLLGGRVALASGFGVLAEAGVLYHRFAQTIEDLPPPMSVAPTASLDMDVSLLQGAFNAGVYF